MRKIVNMKLEKELEFDGEVVLTYSIEYPKIISKNCLTCCERKFNSYNLEKALELQKKAEGELYEEAVSLYKYNKENCYPLMVYEIVVEFKITCNSNSLLSLYSDEYIFTGGAHGSTTRTAQTWNLCLGRQMELYEFFCKEPYFLQRIFNGIIMKIKEEPEIYFDDYCTLVLENFNPKSFYLVPNGIVIYYGQYDIAPYSSGIREFCFSLKN